MDISQLVDDYIQKEIGILQSLNQDDICQALKILMDAWNEERDIFIFGNGGSSATASHFASDFNKGISETLEKKYRFHCLNDNVPALMAIANDIGFAEVFRQQLMDRVRVNDIVIAISASGNSENIIRAAVYAKEQGAFILALTGYDGGKLKELADLNLHANVNSMQITEDVHMIFDHLMMSVLYKVLCGKEHLR